MNPFSQVEKKFSILTPCYGDTYRHLERFAETLDKQEYKNLEWILTFDGKSTKGEKEMKKVMAKYPDLDISYYTIEHAGACAARNNSARHATGDFYVFLSPDCWMYPETLRMWANEFEDPKINRVWGMYDVVNDNGEIMMPVGQAPITPEGKVWYPAFKYSPYADASFPIRKEAFIEWDENCKSLNDWEYSVRHLAQDNYKGDDWKYIPYHFFAAETPQKGGLSNDSMDNWEERKKYIQEKNGIKEEDICVTSLGAPAHAFNVAEMLPAEYLPMPSFKKHHYKAVYLLGFYTREQAGSRVTQTHMDIFTRNKGKNIIHWIGTDIYDLFWHDSFMKLKVLRKWFEKNKVIHLCECEATQKELKEVGIDAKIIPIPPKKLYDPLPLPKDFTVGIYMPQSETYNPALMDEVVRSMPDVKFILFGDEDNKGAKGENWEQVGYIDFDEWMPKMSCNLRITNHDGLPLTPLQFLTAGRNVVTNVPIKGAIEVSSKPLHWKSGDVETDISLYRENIVAGIRQAQKNPLDPKIAQYWRAELSPTLYAKRIRGLYETV